MIWNDDETYSRTPQSNTWAINKRIQLKDLHMSQPKREIKLAATTWHPEPCLLNLKWTYEGYWILVPMDLGQTGPRFKDKRFRVARVETYIDTDGVVRKGLLWFRRI